jgi:hypothetical protein
MKKFGDDSRDYIVEIARYDDLAAVQLLEPWDCLRGWKVAYTAQRFRSGPQRREQAYITNLRYPSLIEYPSYPSG